MADVGEKLLGRGVRVLVQGFDHAGGAVEAVVDVGRFGDAVGVEEDLVAREEVDRAFFIFDAVEAADYEVVAALEELESVVAVLDGGVLVTAVGICELAGGDLEDSEPDGDEHLFRVVRADGRVGLGQDLARGDAEHRTALDDDLGGHHEEGGRDAFAGDVGHNEAEVIVVDQEVVVEVAADFLGGVHAGVEVEFTAIREGREDVRHHGLLDGVRGVELDLGGRELLAALVEDETVHQD